MFLTANFSSYHLSCSCGLQMTGSNPLSFIEDINKLISDNMFIVGYLRAQLLKL